MALVVMVELAAGCNFRMVVYMYFPSRLFVHVFSVSGICKEKPHPVSSAARREVIGKHLKRNHMFYFRVITLCSHNVMPF